MNRDEGHKIYIETEFTNTTHSAVGSLQQTFKIVVPGDYNNQNFVPESYLTSIHDSSVSANSGEILNTNLQLSLLLKVQTRTPKFENLNTQII